MSTTASPTDAGLTAGELASASGLTVRTLHHWEELGLIAPSARTVGGHRRYGANDITTLYRVVALRQLGVALRDIRRVLAEDVTVTDTLRRQLDDTEARLDSLHQLLNRLRRSVAAIDDNDLDAAGLLDLVAETVRASPPPTSGEMYRPADTSAASVLASLLEGVTSSHVQLRRLLDNPDEVLRRPAPLAGDTSPVQHPSVRAAAGSLLVHTIVFEDHYLHRVIQGRPDVREQPRFAALDLAGFGSCGDRAITEPLPDRFCVREFRNYAEAVFGATFEYVANASDDELAREIPGPGRAALTWSMKVWELVAQVAAHAFAHRGQLDVLIHLASRRAQETATLRG
jgi:DNA-binding transcriptional MerR regulator/uncharacterized damage-inducible protein DinB